MRRARRRVSTALDDQRRLGSMGVELVGQQDRSDDCTTEGVPHLVPFYPHSQLLAPSSQLPVPSPAQPSSQCLPATKPPPLLLSSTRLLDCWLDNEPETHSNLTLASPTSSSLPGDPTPQPVNQSAPLPSAFQTLSVSPSQCPITSPVTLSFPRPPPSIVTPPN